MGGSRVNGSVILLLILFSSKVVSYEKTLRKIVRKQAKMVQRPFSDNVDVTETIWKNMSLHNNYLNMFPSISSKKTILNAMQRPKISTIFAAIEQKARKPQFSKKIATRRVTNEQRTARNTYAMNVSSSSYNDELIFSEVLKNKSDMKLVNNDYYQLPVSSQFFPPVEEHELENHLPKEQSISDTVLIPSAANFTKNDDLKIIGIVMPKAKLKENPEKILSVANQYGTYETDPQNERADFLIDTWPVDNTQFTSNISMESFTCSVIKETKVDIDAQEMFAQLNIEPSWISKMHYWTHVYNSRYEALMRNPKWPPLKVILIFNTHVDTIWKKSFEEYHKEVVGKIISNIVKKLQFYDNLSFSWHEVSHLSYWWKHASAKSRAALKRHVKSGKLEITTGGWVEPDEATTHVYGLLHQFIEGHQWLKQHLNYTPKVGWLTNSVTHSPTTTYFLSAANINHMIFTNVHYAWEQYLAEYQYSDFIWLQNWDQDIFYPSKLNEELNKIGNERYPKHGVLAHYLQFNSAGLKSCGPNHLLCTTEYNFAKPNKNLDVSDYNVKDKTEIILEQYSKTGTISSHNVIIAPVGGTYMYDKQSEFDYQYNNYKKIADFVNANKEIYKATIEFGTAYDYFSTIIQKQKVFPTLKGDFLNFADINSGIPAYWTGFYTTRPVTKILLRRLQSTLRSTEMLLSYALNFSVLRRFNVTEIFELLIKSREITARLLDRNVASGTITAHALEYVHNKILTTVKDCWYIQEVAASFMTLKPDMHNKPYLQKYVYRNDEFTTAFKTVSPGDQLYIFNSLSHERTEIVELITRYPNLRILDHHKKDLTIQINPIWSYNSDNFIRISTRYFKIIFAVMIPPMTMELFQIKVTFDVTLSAATIFCLDCTVDGVTNNKTFPFKIEPIRPGDIQLESYKHRLIFEEVTGFIKTVIEKETNIEKAFYVDYGAFKSSYFNSGMFLFNTDINRPLKDVLKDYRHTKIMLIITGQLTTELTVIYGRLLQHTTKIFNLLRSPFSNAIYIESKVDYEISPKHRELELFLSIQTDIGNGFPPKIYTDNNGFQFTGRILNISRRIESNMYPMTSMAFIQDRKSRFTFITDHAQGVTALQEGQLVFMLDRRVLFNDDRGTNEGLADSGPTCHRNFILLENLFDDISKRPKSQDELILPSLSAVYLSNTLDYILDIFMINKNHTDSCHYKFLPLVKTSFPCDVAVLSYRIIIKKSNLRHYIPNTGLMTLYRQSVSCHIDTSLTAYCNGDSNFSIEKIIRNTKAVYQTNLVGTTEGVQKSNFNLVNFPPMELITLRIHF